MAKRTAKTGRRKRKQPLTAKEQIMASEDISTDSELRRLAQRFADSQCDLDLLTISSRYEPLRAELRRHVNDGWIHHPLFVGEVRNADYCGHIHTTIDTRQRRLESLLGEGRYDDAVMTHETPYMLDALEQYANHLDDAMFWKTFGMVWQMSENLWQYQPAIRRIMDHNRPRRDEMMTAEERHAVGTMPDPIAIYRGYTRPGSMKGWSWTTDADKAEWFARRFADAGGACFVAEGTVSKQYLIAYFTERNESEIVVDPCRVVVSTTRRIRVASSSAPSGGSRPSPPPYERHHQFLGERITKWLNQFVSTLWRISSFVLRP